MELAGRPQYDDLCGASPAMNNSLFRCCCCCTVISRGPQSCSHPAFSVITGRAATPTMTPVIMQAAAAAHDDLIATPLLL